MVYEARKQSMAWMETDYTKHTHFWWKIKWRMKHLGALWIMGETVSWQLFIYLFIYLFKQYLLITFAANGNYWVDLETLQANLGPNEIIGFQNLEESRQKSAMLWRQRSRVQLTSSSNAKWTGVESVRSLKKLGSLTVQSTHVIIPMATIGYLAEERDNNKALYLFRLVITHVLYFQPLCHVVITCLVLCYISSY